MSVVLIVQCNKAVRLHGICVYFLDLTFPRHFLLEVRPVDPLTPPFTSLLDSETPLGKW